MERKNIESSYEIPWVSKIWFQVEIQSKLGRKIKFLLYKRDKSFGFISISLIRLICTSNLTWWTFEIKVIRYGPMEETSIAISYTARSNEQIDNQWNDEINRERITEALDKDLAGKLAKDITNVCREDLYEHDVNC